METPSREPKYFIWLLIVSTYYYSTVALPKLAVLALYGRLWTVNPYRTIILVLAAIITLTAVVSGIMCLNMCRPFKYNWDTTIPGGTCYNKQEFFLWASLPNILTDLVMLAMPIPIVYNLNVSMKVKLGLILTFATGILYVSASPVLTPNTKLTLHHLQRPSNLNHALRHLLPRKRRKRRILELHRPNGLERRRTRHLPNQRLPTDPPPNPKQTIRQRSLDRQFQLAIHIRRHGRLHAPLQTTYRSGLRAVRRRGPACLDCW